MLEPNSEIGAKNVRRIAAVVCDNNSSFEVIHGLLDLLMIKAGSKMHQDYKLVEDPNDPRFFTRRGVSIFLKGKKIGSMGVIHPEVLHNFELKYPVSALEIEFEPMFEHFKNIK